MTSKVSLSIVLMIVEAAPSLTPSNCFLNAILTTREEIDILQQCAEFLF